MLRQFKKLDIELIQLHNLHNYCVNLPMLFRYIRRHHIPVVWVMHGTWAYTGKCVHHVLADCNKWKTGCGNCPQLKTWPIAKVDRTSFLWKWKKKQTEQLENLTIVAPSEWIGGLLKESFLAKHPVRYIPHGVNTHIFQPTESDFRERYGCKEKIILLGVADRWRQGKGLEDMIELANRMGERYQVVVVGAEKDDPRIPDNIISIPYTNSRQELAQIYTAADLLIQPTRAEMFGLVGAEALACGTPMITYRSGGSPEIIDKTCGSVVECGDIDGLIRAIEDAVAHRRFTKENCLKRAEQFSLDKMCERYLKLFDDILRESR